MNKDETRWKVCLRLREFPQRLQSKVWKDGGYVHWVMAGKYYGATENECADHAAEIEFADIESSQQAPTPESPGIVETYLGKAGSLPSGNDVTSGAAPPDALNREYGKPESILAAETGALSKQAPAGDVRERFEAWVPGAKSDPRILDRDENGQYVYRLTMAHWAAWQAALTDADSGRDALEWYAEKAVYISQRLESFKDGSSADPIMAVLTELALDAGGRAQRALKGRGGL